MGNQLEGKTVVITGCNRGLGRALVEAFGNEGALVCGIARDSSSIDQMQSECSTFEFIGRTADVGDFAQVNESIEGFYERTRQLDYVFNNAAVYPKENFLEQSVDSWDSALRTNVIGPANVCRAVLPHMIYAGFGRIYNVGSWADLMPIERSSSYSTSKGGIHALTKAIAADIAHLHLDIEVHEWIPGHLNTRMSDFTGIDVSVSAGWAVELVKREASSKSVIFENDQEWIPPKRLKERVLEKLTFWR